MLNPVRKGEEDSIEAIRYRRRLKIFENFLFSVQRHANVLKISKSFTLTISVCYFPTGISQNVVIID